MKRLLAIIICLVAVSVHAQDFDLFEHVTIIDKVDHADNYNQKQQALKLMQSKHALYGKSETYRKAGEADDLYCDWMDHYAELNRFFGNYTEAEKAYTEIISSISNDYHPASKTARLNRLNIWLRQGKYTEIINMITRQPKLLPDDTEAYNEQRFILAEAYYNRNLDDGWWGYDKDKAYRYLNDLILDNIYSNDDAYFRALCNLGMICSGYDDTYLDDAYRYMSDGMNYFHEKMADKSSYSNCMNYNTLLSNIAYVEARMHEYDNALQHINEAMEWQKKNLPSNDNHYITSMWKKAEILLMKAEYTLDAGKKEAVEAYKEYFKAQKNYILHNFAFMTEHERQSFWAAQYEPLTSCYKVGDADPLFAYEVALFAKNILIQTNCDIRTISAKSKDKKLAMLIEQYDESRNDDQKRAETEKAIIALLGPNQLYKAFDNSMKITPEDVRRQLGKNDIAIEWIETPVAGELTYVALTMNSKGEVSFTPTISRTKLMNESVCNQLGCLDFDYALYSKNSSNKDYIYNDIFLGFFFWGDIISDDCTYQNVYFAPTGLLNILGLEYLFEDMADCKFYRMSSTGELCRKAQKISRNPRTLIVGGIDFNEYDVASNTTVNPDRNGFNVMARKYAFGKDKIFVKLNGADREVDSIYCIMNDTINAQLIKGTKATERVVKEKMPDYDIVHLSTHGYSLDFGNSQLLQRDSLMQDQLMLRSGIAFAGANVAGMADDVEDGLLTAREISEMDLSGVKLVILSACQTAVAKMTDDEVASIARALKKAGVEAMIVSLWSTGDDASQVFFTEFFRYMKEDPNHSIRDAFNKARDFMKANEEYPVKYKEKVFSGSTLSRSQERILTRSVNLNQPHYYDSYILLDALQ